MSCFELFNSHFANYLKIHTNIETNIPLNLKWILTLIVRRADLTSPMAATKVHGPISLDHFSNGVLPLTVAWHVFLFRAKSEVASSFFSHVTFCSKIFLFVCKTHKLKLWYRKITIFRGFKLLQIIK